MAKTGKSLIVGVKPKFLSPPGIKLDGIPCANVIVDFDPNGKCGKGNTAYLQHGRP
jgi:hypothetical protein